MLIIPNTGVVEGLLYDANGQPTSLPTKVLSLDEARLLREYKKFLQAHHLREALYCSTCWSNNLSDGMEAHVNEAEVLMKCRHRMIYFKGSSF